MATLTVGELRDALEGLDDDIPVRLAFQPSWPLQFEASAETVLVDLARSDDDESTEPGPDSQPVFFIAEGGHPDDPYAPAAVTSQLGWR